MSRTEQSSQKEVMASAEALPDLNPVHEVGWIFRDGACIAVVRQDEEVRPRVLAD